MKLAHLPPLTWKVPSTTRRTVISIALQTFVHVLLWQMPEKPILFVRYKLPPKSLNLNWRILPQLKMHHLFINFYMELGDRLGQPVEHQPRVHSPWADNEVEEISQKFRMVE